MKQSVKDRMHEGEGMVRHEMKSHHMSGSHAHGMYKNMVEMPEQPWEGNRAAIENEPGYGMASFKGECDPIALGQAGGAGMKMDEKRIHSQFKDYHWD